MNEVNADVAENDDDDADEDEDEDEDDVTVILQSTGGNKVTG
jgi:hypothetical protein